MDVRELAEVLAQTRQWQALTTPGVEESYEGHDQTGAVTARVDATGALQAVSIADRWARLLATGALSDAIREAAAAAVSVGYGFAPPAAGAAAIDWAKAFDDLVSAPPVPVSDDDVARAKAQIADAATTIERDSARLSVADAQELFLSQLEALSSRSTVVDPVGRPGTVGSAGQIELELSPLGLLIGCTVSERWVASQSGHMLTMRIEQLLADHRSEG